MRIIQKRSAQPDQWPAVWPAEPGQENNIDADISPDSQQVSDFLQSNTSPRILIRFDTWVQHRHLFASADALGVVLDTDLDLNLLGPELRELSLVKVVFQGFTDGKGYSIASILRNEHHYTGELRAVNVVKENLALLEQCGFDSYQLVEGTDLDRAIEVFDQLVPNTAA